ncbi:MAG: inositol monophosphatase family protein [Candidatus Competibacteraceae bacterium]|jgi:fructose-1,6-bisphosphatase/inositol monophosphatase family enzyme|nr:inositol monophosphatase family protein [Candidatus Competibacteraceae bacterium]
MNLHEFSSYYLPLMVTAGDYALQIQSRIENRNKAGENAFSQALTDADLSVQNFIEIATLARFPEIAFYGEEEEQSLNAKYFVGDADYKLFLDPINGTRFYQDQLPLFDIIISLNYRGEYAAGISYVPGTETFYLGFKDDGAYTVSKQEVMQGVAYRPLQVPVGGGTLVTLNCPQLKQALGNDFNVLDAVQDYDPACCEIATFSVFTGAIGGFLGYNCSYLDSGVIAFIASLAGAIVTDFAGNPVTAFSQVSLGRIPQLVVTRDPELHSQVLERIADCAELRNPPMR